MTRDGELVFSNEPSSETSRRKPSEARGRKYQSSYAQGFGGHPSRATRAKDGGARRDRTDDLKLAKLPLSQLSYGPDQFPFPVEAVVGPDRFELSTPRLSSVCSNQLSYGPAPA